MMREQGNSRDVIVVGAGAAGLACAADLLAGGLRVGLLEASDAVGGRMRTDRSSGFVTDRGFQVLNTAYPQVKRRLALRPLRLRPFTPGVLVHTGGGRLLRFTDPTRRPRESRDLLPGRLATARDLAALGILTAQDTLLPPRLLRARPDRTTLTALAEAGISDGLVETFFRPFLSGVADPRRPAHRLAARRRRTGPVRGQARRGGHQRSDGLPAPQRGIHPGRRGAEGLQAEREPARGRGVDREDAGRQAGAPATGRGHTGLGRSR